jgi:hypothetical protein
MIEGVFDNHALVRVVHRKESYQLGREAQAAQLCHPRQQYHFIRSRIEGDVLEAPIPANGQVVDTTSSRRTFRRGACR